MAAETTLPPDGYVAVANLEIASVTPQSSGFVLQASGQDALDYMIELHLDMPIDRRTQTVLGELLSQSEWRVWRRNPQPLKRRVRPGVASA